MPGAPGNAVVLDPFRTIIEVGWNIVPKYIVIRTAIELEVTAILSEEISGWTCPPPEYDEHGNPIGPRWPYEGIPGGWKSGCLISWQVDILPDQETGKAYERTATGIWKDKTESLSVDTGEHPVTITGLTVETIATGNHAEWAYAGVGSGGNPNYIVIVEKPTAEEASDPDYGIGGTLFGNYYETMSIPAKVLAHALVGPPECGIYDLNGVDTFQSNPVTVSPTSFTNADYDQAYLATADEVGAGTLALSGITVSYRGATYKPIAYQHNPSSLIRSPAGHRYIHGRHTSQDPYGPFNDEFVVAILCEIEESTA